MRTVSDFLISAFNKFVQGWVSDALAELAYVQVPIVMRGCTAASHHRRRPRPSVDCSISCAGC